MHSGQASTFYYVIFMTCLQELILVSRMEIYSRLVAGAKHCLRERLHDISDYYTGVPGQTSVAVATAQRCKQRQ
jgi:hypothetical protein